MAYDKLFRMDGTKRLAVHLYDRDSVSLCGRVDLKGRIYLRASEVEARDWGVCTRCEKKAKEG